VNKHIPRCPSWGYW